MTSLDLNIIGITLWRGNTLFSVAQSIFTGSEYIHIGFKTIESQLSWSLKGLSNDANYTSIYILDYRIEAQLDINGIYSHCKIMRQCYDYNCVSWMNQVFNFRDVYTPDDLINKIRRNYGGFFLRRSDR